MKDHLVFIPCRLDRRDARSALIEDADGWPRKVIGPLGRVAGRLVVAARWLRAAAGRHLVRFGDGAEWWVTQGPGDPDAFVPLGWGPVPLRSASPASRPVASGAGPAVCVTANEPAVQPVARPAGSG